MDTFSEARARMIDDQIRGRGVSDGVVLEAMGAVPRHFFVRHEDQASAYEDRPLPIGADQTISQPYIVALMLELMKLDRSDKVLEVGAGSGYAAAVLAEIVAEVFAIERIESLAEFARGNLDSAGYSKVHVRHADGSNGWPEMALFDAILVSAGARSTPKSLINQLKIGGRLVVPIGVSVYGQELIRVTRTSEEEFTSEGFGGVRFVPLISDSAGDSPNSTTSTPPKPS